MHENRTSHLLNYIPLNVCVCVNVGLCNRTLHIMQHGFKMGFALQLDIYNINIPIVHLHEKIDRQLVHFLNENNIVHTHTHLHRYKHIPIDSGKVHVYIYIYIASVPWICFGVGIVCVCLCRTMAIDRHRAHVYWVR